MKVLTGKMLAGYAESAVALAFERDYPEGRKPDVACLSELTAANVDVAGFCEDFINEAGNDETKAAITSKYADLQIEEVDIRNAYVTARANFRDSWKAGEIDRKTYLEQSSMVRAAFNDQLRAFHERAHARSLEIMSEFLCGLGE